MRRTHRLTHHPRLLASALAAAILAAVVGTVAVLPARAAALRVVATTEDLASLTREIGGDKVEVTALARGYQDPHQVEAKPSFIFAVSRADLLVVVGRELELGWLPALQSSSRNGSATGREASTSSTVIGLVNWAPSLRAAWARICTGRAASAEGSRP